jgi:hypothetical protein
VWLWTRSVLPSHFAYTVFHISDIASGPTITRLSAQHGALFLQRRDAETLQDLHQPISAQNPDYCVLYIARSLGLWLRSSHSRVPLLPFSSSSSSSICGAGRNAAYGTSAFEAVCTLTPVLVPLFFSRGAPRQTA